MADIVLPLSVSVAASSILVDPNEDVVLTWAIVGIHKIPTDTIVLSVDPNGTPIPGSGSLVSYSSPVYGYAYNVFPAVTTTYTITVRRASDGAVASASITVTVRPPSVSISASPNPCSTGSTLTLTYSSARASSLSIDNGVGVVSVPIGTVTIPNFTAATRYTITATGPTGIVATAFVDAVLAFTNTVVARSFITATGTYTVPSDFISYISTGCIGAGPDAANGGGGSGGGAYAEIVSLPGVTVGAVYNVQVAAAAFSPAQTWFKDASTVMAVPGSPPALLVGGQGGQASGSVGTTKFNGGNGGDGAISGGDGAGGGAAGPNGAGANGTGNPFSIGGTGDNGTGGAGGLADASGSNGTEIGGSHGSGGGGGGAVLSDHGGNGGLYGAGGGGGGSQHGAGAQGLIIFTYNAFVSITNYSPITGTVAASPTPIIAGSPTTLTWSSSNATAASLDHGIGSVSTSGSVSVSPLVTTTYTLTLTAPHCATVTIPVTVIVLPLPAPTGFKAVGQCGGIVLSWDAVSPSTNYILSRGTAPGGPYTPIFTGPDLTVIDSQVDEITYVTHYYVVQTINNAATSANSIEANAFATTTPATPTGLTVTPASGALAISASASAHAATYNLYASTIPSDPTPPTKITGLIVPRFVMEPFDGTPTIYVRMTALNDCGESSKSTEVSAAPFPTELWKTDPITEFETSYNNNASPQTVWEQDGDKGKSFPSPNVGPKSSWS